MFVYILYNYRCYASYVPLFLMLLLATIEIGTILLLSVVQAHPYYDLCVQDASH